MLPRIKPSVKYRTRQPTTFASATSRSCSTSAFTLFAAASIPFRTSFADGTRADFSGENLAKDSGIAMLVRMSGKNVDDAMLRRYAHHPDHFVCLVAGLRVMGVGSAYLGKPSGRDTVHKQFAMELFHSPGMSVRSIHKPEPAVNFPERPIAEGRVTALPKETLVALGIVAGCASTDVTHYVLNSVLFSPDDG